MPVYGLAECSVALCFPPVGRGPRFDRVAREPFEREGRAVAAAESDATALEFVSVGRALPRHEVRIVDDAGADVPERRVGRLVFRGPSMTSGYYRKPEATAAITLDGRLARQRRPRLPRGRRDPHLRPPQGPHHQGRPQPRAAGDRGGGRRGRGHPARLRGRVRRRRTRASAPRASSSWPRRAPPTPPTRERLAAAVTAQRGRRRRACRPTRSCSSPRAPCRRPRAARCAARRRASSYRGGRDRPRLAHDARRRRRCSSPTPRPRTLRPAVRGAGRALYAAWLAVALPAIVLPAWLAVAVVPSRRFAFRVARRASRLALRARRLPPRRDGPRAPAAGPLRPRLEPRLLRRRAALLALLPARLPLRGQARGPRLPRRGRLRAPLRPPHRRSLGRGRRAWPTPSRRPGAARAAGARPLLPRGHVHRPRRACVRSASAPSRPRSRPACPSCRSRCAGTRQVLRGDWSPAAAGPRLALGRASRSRRRARAGRPSWSCATAWPTRSPPTAASRGSTSWPPARGRPRRT